MTIERYTRSVEEHTANGACDPYTLRTEIDADPNIGIPCHAVSVTGDMLDVYMNQGLGPAALAALNGRIGAHIGVPIDRSLRIGDHLEVPAVLWEPPIALDYKTGLATRLRRKETFVQGELRTVEYHPGAVVNLDTGAITYTGDPVIREDFEYTRDAAGFARSRVQTITWLRKDGTDHVTKKTLNKVYSPGASMNEGKKRRRNVVNQVELTVSALLLETELNNQGGDVQATLELGRDLASLYGKEIADYENIAKQDILVAVENDTQFAWLDNTPPSLGGTVSIRAAVLAALDIWS